MERDAVVEAVAGELREVLDRLGRVLVEELDGDGAVCSVERRVGHGGTVSESLASGSGTRSRCPSGRSARSIGTLGGVVHESAQVLLPRFVRRSRLYEATAKNALRIAVEAVGASSPRSRPRSLRRRSPSARRPGTSSSWARSRLSASRRSGSWRPPRTWRTARGCTSPPSWTSSSARRPRRGARDRLGRRAAGDARERVGPDRAADRHPAPRAGGAARDAGEFREDASGLPGPEELASLYRGLREEAARERGSLLEVSVGMGMAFLLSAKTVTSTHLAIPYREDWAPLRRRGSPPTPAEWGLPTPGRSRGHFDPKRPSWTERLL